MTSFSTNLGLLVLRVVLGVTFIAHGWQKIGLNGLDATTQGFTGMGMVLPEVTAPLVAVTEIAGGALLVLGLLARIAAVLLTPVSLVAIFAVHLSGGFFAADGGIELVLVLAAGTIALALTGPGAVSVDAAVWPRILPARFASERRSTQAVPAS